MAKRGPKPGTRHSGMFTKNDPRRSPGGRPKMAEGWRERIRNDPELQELAFLLAKGDLHKTKRVLVNPGMVTYLLDQGFGRAPQTVELKGMVTLADAASEIRGWLAEQPGDLIPKLDAWLAGKAKEDE